MGQKPWCSAHYCWDPKNVSRIENKGILYQFIPFGGVALWPIPQPSVLFHLRFPLNACSYVVGCQKDAPVNIDSKTFNHKTTLQSSAWSSPYMGSYDYQQTHLHIILLVRYPIRICIMLGYKTTICVGLNALILRLPCNPLCFKWTFLSRIQTRFPFISLYIHNVIMFYPIHIPYIYILFHFFLNVPLNSHYSTVLDASYYVIASSPGYRWLYMIIHATTVYGPLWWIVNQQWVAKIKKQQQQHHHLWNILGSCYFLISSVNIICLPTKITLGESVTHPLSSAQAQQLNMRWASHSTLGGVHR